MHLYPARLGSASPASVARQSLLACVSFSFSRSRPLPSAHSPSCIRFFFFFVRLALPLSPAPRNRSVDLRTLKRRRSRWRKKEHVLTEGDACLSCASFPPLSSSSSSCALDGAAHTAEKDQVHPAEMHSRFPIHADDKGVTLSECVARSPMGGPVCDFDSESKYRLNSNWLLE